MFHKLTKLNKVLPGSALEYLVPHASIRYISGLICCQLDRFVLKLCNMNNVYKLSLHFRLFVVFIK